MTREEAIEVLQQDIPCEQDTDLIEALEMAIQALEQEPCDVPDTNVGDLISRKALISHIENQSREWGEDYDVQQILGDIEDLKPQEPKTVIYSGDGYADGYMVYDMAECPNCGYEYEDNDKDWGLSFCPNCGQALDWERSEDDNN